MFIRYAGGTNLQASTPGLVNFLPCFAPGWLANVLPPVRTPRGCASPRLATMSFMRDLMATGSSPAPLIPPM